MNRLLLCVDGSSYTDACCKYAAWLAKQSNADIHTLYLSDPKKYEVAEMADFCGSIGGKPCVYHLADQIKDIEREKAEFLEHTVSDIVFPELGSSSRLTFHHNTGILVDSVEAFEKEHVCDMVILGKRGENANHAKEHLGSAVERVVRASNSPCLVTPSKYRDIKTIMIAYDGSSSCRRAVDWITVMPFLRNMSIHLVSVASTNHEEVCMDGLYDARCVLQTEKIDIHSRMLSGNVEEAISEYVDAYNIDMLVMGAYGHSRIRELLIGSTTNQLLRTTHVPVLMFR